MPEHLLPGRRRAGAGRRRAHRLARRSTALSRVDDIVLTHSHFDHVKDLPLLSDLVVGRREDAGHHLGELTSLRPDAAGEHVQRRALAGLHRASPRRGSRCSSSELRSSRRDVPGRPVHRALGAGEPPGRVVRLRGPAQRNGAGHQRRHRPDRAALGGAQRAPRTSRRCCWRPASPTSCRSWPTSPATSRPRTLRAELGKFQRNGAEVLLYHLKPAFVAELKRQVAGLPVRVLELGERFEF